MFKCITLIKKKPGISRAAFIDYYENFHAPLVRNLFPPISIYRRNYVDSSDHLFLGEDAAMPEFDVITEGIFNSRAEAEAFVVAASDADKARQMEADEANFVTPGYARTYVVEVHESPRLGSDALDSPEAQ